MSGEIRNESWYKDVSQEAVSRKGRVKKMARLQDNQGAMLGGLHSHTARATGAARGGSRTSLNPHFGPEETVPGLACSYGCLAYSYALPLRDGLPGRSRLPACHNPVEAPDERHHCDSCGGDYCSVHAESATHDWGHVILPA